MWNDRGHTPCECDSFPSTERQAGTPTVVMPGRRVTRWCPLVRTPGLGIRPRGRRWRLGNPDAHHTLRSPSLRQRFCKLTAVGAPACRPQPGGRREAGHGDRGEQTGRAHQATASPLHLLYILCTSNTFHLGEKPW